MVLREAGPARAAGGEVEAVKVRGAARVAAAGQAAAGRAEADPDEDPVRAEDQAEAGRAGGVERGEAGPEGTRAVVGAAVMAVATTRALGSVVAASSP